MGAGKGCGTTRSIGYFEGRGRVSHVVLGWFITYCVDQAALELEVIFLSVSPKCQHHRHMQRSKLECF